MKRLDRRHRSPPMAPRLVGLVLLLAVAAASLGLAEAQGRAPEQAGRPGSRNSLPTWP